MIQVPSQTTTGIVYEKKLMFYHLKTRHCVNVNQLLFNVATVIVFNDIAISKDS